MIKLNQILLLLENETEYRGWWDKPQKSQSAVLKSHALQEAFKLTFYNKIASRPIVACFP